jgi:hypothetical protein
VADEDGEIRRIREDVVNVESFRVDANKSSTSQVYRAALQ